MQRLTTLLAAALMQLALALPASAHDLEALIASAQARDEGVSAAIASAQAADAILAEVRSGVLPSYDLVLSATLAGADRTTFQPGNTTQAASATLTMAQTLYQFGLNDTLVEAQARRVDAAWLSVAGATQDVRRRVTEAAIALWAAQERLRIIETQRQDAQTQVEGIRQLFEEGFVALPQVLAVEAELADLELQILGAEAEVRNAELTLQTLTFDQTAHIHGEEVQVLARRPFASEVEAVQILLATNSDVLVAEANAQAAASTLDAVALENAPALTLEGQYGAGRTSTRVQDQTDLINSESNTARIGINLNIPLGQSGRQASRIAQAEAQFQGALRAFNQTRESLEFATQQLWRQAEATQRQLDRLITLEAVEQERIAQSQAIFEEGFIALDELLRAKQRRGLIQLQILEAKAQLYIIHARLRP